ncbi:InlB B-repeat-containing protein [Candidatus Saccharibacteria bacterium]|nr:InlB B-repeat-containing protein [Candidatus Saccharibacteria bacterium]
MSGFLKHKAWVIVICLFFAPFFFSTSAFADASLSMSISSSDLVLKLLPKSSDGTFAKSENLTIAVDLTGTGGYTLGIRSDVSGDDATNLVNTIDNTKKFTSISSAISESDFSNASNTQYNNKWGYLPSKYNSANNTNFLPAPSTNGDILDYTEDDNVSRTYTIAVGARADLNTTTGTYTGTFVITAVANFGCNASATTIGDAICMQDMNDDVINSMEEGRQYQLKDNRDWKVYYIAKMKDGRVWMTQNLDLDLETTPNKVAALTHDNTDLGWTVLDTNATWTPSAATVTSLSALGGNSSNTPKSFDRGDYYIYPDSSSSYTNYNTKLSCENAHNDGTCQHYHAGNYYNWTAAVASNDTSGITAQYTTMPDSICPAGWRLPTGKESSTSYSEINYTVIKEEIVKNFITNGNDAVYIPDASTGFFKLRNSPMYMAVGGYVNGTSYYVVNYGYYWSSTLNSSSGAFAPRFSPSNFYPAVSLNRGYSVFVRCVARQSSTGTTTVIFDKNANDATGTMNNQIYNSNTLNTLPSNTFTRAGYVFKGWNTKADGSGYAYEDEAQYYAVIGKNITEDTLYAQWAKVYTITFNMDSHTDGIYFDGVVYTNGQTTQAIDGQSYTLIGMFDTKYGLNNWNVTAGSLARNTNTTIYIVTNNATITATSKIATVNMSTLTNSSDPVSSTCKNELATPELVYDPRDNEAYYVARLCDGKYWMLDNLRLDLSNSTTLNSLSVNNTNASEQALSCLKTGFYNGNPCASPYTTAAVMNNTGNTSSTAALVNVDDKDNIAPVTYGLSSSKRGVYYNYCAASAGSYCYDISSGNDKPNTYYDIEGDLCPSGWHLPTGTSNGNNTEDYNVLVQSYNSGSYDFRDQFSVPYSGYLISSSYSSLGTTAHFWSSTYNSNYYMMLLNVSNSTSPGTLNDMRHYGLSVRCVLNSD